jgi:hypothetical protein
MSSPYAATVNTLPHKISATIMTANQAGAGDSTSSPAATPAQIGMMIARCRQTVLARQPASVSSCRTQSTFFSGSLNPAANLIQPRTLGSPGSLANSAAGK